MIKSLVASILFVGSLGATECPIRNAVYNDESYTITLSVEELSYTYDNLATYFNSVINAPPFAETYDLFSSITYNNMSFRPMSLYANNLHWNNDDGNPEYDLFFYNETTTHQFELKANWNNISFESDLILVATSTYYSDIKSAIELDIQANEPQPEPTSSNIYSIIYDFFSDYVFTSPDLDNISDSGLGLSFNQWLCHTATLVLLALGVLWLILVVRWIFRVFSGLVNV